MIIYILISIILILIYCTTCNKSNFLVLCVLILFKITGMDELNCCSTRIIEGGRIANNKKIKNIVERYSKLHPMIKKQFKYTGKKYKYDDTFFNKMYQLYKYKSDTKKWGNVSYRPPLSIKFNKKIMDILNSIDKNGSVLDYGCGDGWTLKYFEDNNIKDLSCVDIDDYRTYAKKSSFIKNSYLTSMNEQVKDNSVDLVVALQSIHHIEFLGDKSKFVYRIEPIIKSVISKIKPGGNLLIREHDVKTNDDACPVIFEHLLYDLMELKDKSMSYNKIKDWVKKYHINHNGWYFSKDFLHKLLEKNGMKLLETEFKKGINMSHIYNSIYVKN